MLVAGGANLNIQDNDGRTARMLASNADDFELAFYLESEYLEHLVSHFSLANSPSVQSEIFNQSLNDFPFFSCPSTLPVPPKDQEQFQLIDFRSNNI